jgi:hypothetical protein
MKEILTLIVAVIMIIAFIAVFLKAGYSVPVALLMGVGLCVPIINVIVLLVFLLSEWPVQRELRALKERFAPALDGILEPIPCLSCGATLPGGATQCSACGWTYQRENR